MRKIYLHIGAHKTATTTIQLNLRDNAVLFQSKYNISYISPTDIQNCYLGIHFKKLSMGELGDSQAYKESLHEAKSALTALLASQEFQDIIISWEGFLGHSALDSYEGIYTHSPKVADSINFLFGDFDLSLILFIRRQDEFIESTYLQQIKENRSISFEEFVDKINIEDLSWLKLVRDFDNYFPNKIKVIPFELIREIGARKFFDTFCYELLRIDISAEVLTIVEHANPSMSSYGVRISRELLPLIHEKNRPILNKIIFKDLSSRVFGKAEFFTPFTRRLIKKACKQDNELLFQTYMEGQLNIDSAPLCDYYIQLS